MTQQNYIYNKMNKDGTNSNINVLTFDSTYTPIAINTGQVVWSGDDGTISIGLKNGSILQVGQEQTLYGIATEVIPNGSVVMLNGTVGSRLKFSKATSAAVIANPKVILGIATTDMEANGFGYVASFGFVNDIYMPSNWLPEQVLYFDIEASAVSSLHGKLTNIRPSGSYLKIPLGTVVYNNSVTGTGRILTRPDIAYSFAQISDIYFPTPLADNDTIRYNAAGGYWFNTQTPYPTIVEATGATYTGDIGVNGGDITTTATTATLFNSAATSLSIGGAATTLNLGNSATGSIATIRNQYLKGENVTQYLFNTVATSLYIGGDASTVAIGNGSGTLTLNNPTVVSSPTQTTVNLWNSNATTVNFAGAATTLLMGATNATTTLRGTTVRLPGVVTTLGGVLYGSATNGTISNLAAGTSGQYLKSNGAAAPSWDTLPASITYTLASGDANGQLKFTPSTGGAYNVNVTGLGTAAYTASTAYAAASHTHTSSNISDATNANTANMIVKRDASGNFSAGTITAALNGNASTATNATYATSAGSATYATSAGSATTATSATSATNATNATNAGNSDTIDNYHIWTGTQAAYDGLTKNASTLYFIVG